MARPSAPEPIAAIATAAGRGGIGVVRISGPSLFTFAQRICGGLAPKARHAHFTRFLDAGGREIDEGLLLYFPAPHSFTGEDVVELQGHGGPVVMQLLLGRCLELGARPAEPGEFTKRAFLNGRLDLAQAEAVADLIEASSSAAARSAVRSLAGEFSREILVLRDELVELRMLVEATLDFPDEELEFLRGADAFGRVQRMYRQLDEILSRAGQGRLLQSGISVVLAGPPNVGKSSLLNRLAGEERAIVTEFAGTTRDTLRETIHIEGIPLHVIDTAGLRETPDPIERAGIERAWREISRADVILRLVDGSAEELRIYDPGIDSALPAGVERITVVNKADLAGDPPARIADGNGVCIRLSALTGEGVPLLRQELLRVAGWQVSAEDVILARQRHIDALVEAQSHLASACVLDSALDLLAEELRLAQEALSSITGEFSSDDLLGVIFSRFCIGK